MEIYLSYVRSLGLKHPFRPCKLSTLYRELTNRIHLIGQKEYAAKRVKETVGDAQTLVRLCKDQKPVYNGYTNFLRSVKLPIGKESAGHWKNVPDGCRENWTFGGAKRASRQYETDEQLRKDFFLYPEVGPLGSDDPSMPLDFDDIASMLNDDICCERKCFFIIVEYS